VGIGEGAVLDYEQLIGEFKNSGAVLVPVLWGAKGSHENALHIRLPEEDVTFIFLNLDTRLEDFKFWMAHELAHVYTPDLAGNNEGEDFADAFAGALLFPKTCAEAAYSETIRQDTVDGEIKILWKHAITHTISLNTVYQQVKHFAQAARLPNLRVAEKIIHAIRNSDHGPLVSAKLFDPMPPEPKRYIAACEHTFRSDFFNALKRMIHENGTGASYVQQVLDTSIQDAMALHEELRH
jgi:Zn-dependent peptidase ImmA (M78 family)